MMARLDSKIEAYLGRKVDFNPIDGEINLQDDGSGAYIATWNAPEAQPTQTQLDSVDSEANRAEELATIRASRKAEYPSIEECVHAILDDDLDALQAKRAEVKARYPKP